MGYKFLNNEDYSIIDTHVHVGRYNDRYFSPNKVSTLMNECGVSSFLVSSTSICGNQIELCINELKELIGLDGQRILPCLWLTEELLKKDKISQLLNCDINWMCLKIHTALYPDEWVSGGAPIKRLIQIARYLSIPILIHTGYDIYCRADKYEKEIATNDDITFILAHGRPIEASLNMLTKYTNVYVDTAFMSIIDIVALVSAGLEDNVLWGTDTPIPLIYYPNITYVQYYKNLMRELITQVGIDVYAKIVHTNASKCFALK